MIRAHFVAALLSVLVQARSQDTLFKHHVALKIAEGPALMHQCSREAPAHVTGFWEVSADTMALVERNLPRLHMPRPDGNQYIGMIIDGQRYVYINHVGGVLSDCMTKACDICDGGHAFWGVLFNASTRQFSGLAFNGQG